ncbi:uncharacterized mitochondrial protein AtMg00810-like [Benincasa hispida]|uniref:uncharacterized mitochondrial protein AtMg00810-like n=1 Tax=Benincasa hispida TaxID=102211 RepID=UPI001900457D|nr:uncharacterized mitochondrial protein AtMg00810-like [Benincasa hispida]
MGIFKPKAWLSEVIDLDKTEPRFYKEAILHPSWKQAMLKEYEALIRNNTWSLTALPQDRKVIGRKWVLHSLDHLHFSQSKSIHSFLKCAHLIDCKPIHSPMAIGASLSLTDVQSLDNPSGYRILVGALQYCTLTRPDISFSVNKLCQFIHAPTISHLQAAKRLLWYLKGTTHHGILLTKSPVLALTCYTDADWASCLDDRQSTSGFCVFLGLSLISWSSSKQKVVS